MMDEGRLAPHCHAIVLAGGSGTRLWPLSRALFPKQLLSFNNDFSLLQSTLKRLSGLFLPECIHIITGEDHVFEVRKQARELDPLLEAGVIAEPRGRNTLPAILLGLDAAWKSSAQADPIIAVFPSDHHITADDHFADNVHEAMHLGEHAWFVTFGIPPHSPETGYGYIERGKMLGPVDGGGENSFEVVRFVEKPDRERAETYLKSGTYFWNSGMFVFPGKQFVDAVRKNQPQLAAWWDTRTIKSLVEEYSSLPSISVDYGIMEQAERIAVVEARFGWDDLGSWEAMHRLGRKDEHGCVTQGDVLALDCADSLLVSRWGTLAAVGLKNIVAVQTRDATLICAREQVQRVKEVVESLKDAGSPLAEVHLTVQRPWGSYTVLEEGQDYKIKRITVLPGGTLSLQYHHHRSEHWVVVRGTAEVVLGEEVLTLNAREWVSIPKTVQHPLTNRADTPLEIIEVQSGDYLEEDDIVRLEDVYGR